MRSLVFFVAAAGLLLGCAREPERAPAYPPAPYGSYGYPYAYPGAYAAPAYPYPGGYAPPAYPQGPGGQAPRYGASAAVAFAQAHLGAPYCWGGNGPSCFDCSGLTHAAWLAGGKSIPRTSTEQATDLPQVAMSLLEPGDIVWRPGHVGLYVGSGLVIHAPSTGDVVRYQEASRFQKAFRP